MVSDELLTFASLDYGFDKSTLRFISESTNQIYAFQKNGRNYIMRFSQKPMKYITQTRAEIDWLYYLAHKGINVSLPLPAVNGELVIYAEADNKTYIVSAYEALTGRFWDKNDPSRWNEKIFFSWGKLMGDMHRLTKDYVPAIEEDVRPAFTGWDERLDRLAACPAVYDIAKRLSQEIMALPKDKDSYGLIHYDVHPWNFLINGDQISVFDFDDCLYGWFALDVGVALYHALWWGRKNDAGHDFAEEIIASFIQGYLAANDLSDFWLTKIPMFMKFRQICKLSWFYDPKTNDAHQEERMRNIVNDMLFTGYEYDPSLLTVRRTGGG